GQFCPVAKAMELLDERWTMLVVRELLAGSTHFNDLRRGVPRMSPSLLSKRLQTLTRAGVVQRSEADGRSVYTLTECGRELVAVVEALGTWSVRWFSDLVEKDLDPSVLMWDIRRTIPLDKWPRARTVVAIRLTGTPPKQSSWWLMVADGDAEVCDFDPGYDVVATVSTSLRALTQIWRGDQSWQRALLDGSVSIDGTSDARRAVPMWIGQSTLAAVPRPA
ncbi:MAG: winged helix-turn-helix transcriptional regulator, partial [Mycobacterium sp.]